MSIANPKHMLPFFWALTGCQTPGSVFKSNVEEAFGRLPKEGPTRVVTEKDIAHMPPPMQRYIRYAGVLGKPLAKSARIKQEGLFKTSLKSEWKKIVAEEYYFPLERAFFWHGTVDFAPFVSANALDKYDRGKGSMWVKLANVFTVANGTGPEYDSASLIRYLNELMWFPSGFIDSAISYTALDDTRTEVTITDGGMTTKAILHFNRVGEIVLFESDERYATTENGLEKAPWLTPVRNYKEFDGYKIPCEGEAIYRLKSGEFEYARLKIVNAEYNRESMYAEE
jgi:hypothetical protein